VVCAGAGLLRILNKKNMAKGTSKGGGRGKNPNSLANLGKKVGNNISKKINELMSDRKFLRRLDEYTTNREELINPSRKTSVEGYLKEQGELKSPNSNFDSSYKEDRLKRIEAEIGYLKDIDFLVENKVIKAGSDYKNTETLIKNYNEGIEKAKQAKKNAESTTNNVLKKLDDSGLNGKFWQSPDGSKQRVYVTTNKGKKVGYVDLTKKEVVIDDNKYRREMFDIEDLLK
jgi:hypothetical protein